MPSQTRIQLIGRGVNKGTSKCWGLWQGVNYGSDMASGSTDQVLGSGTEPVCFLGAARARLKVGRGGVLLSGELEHP